MILKGKFIRRRRGNPSSGDGMTGLEAEGLALAREFGTHSERPRMEFVSCLVEGMVEMMLEEGHEASREERAEAEHRVITTFCEYNEAWEGGETAGQITIRLGTLAFERIVGRGGEPPNYKVWNLLFMETNNAFKNSIGVGRRVEIVG